MAVSLVVHAVLLVGVGLMVPHPRLPETPPERPVQVFLVPLTPIRPPPPQTVKSSAPPQSRPTPAPLVARIHVPKAVAPNAPPSPVPAPPAAAASGKATGSSIAPGPLPGDDTEHGVRALLRSTVGCESPDAVKMTAEERTRCAERFAQSARNAPPIGIDPSKRGAFAAQAAADERRRGQRDALGASPLIIPCRNANGVGSNMDVGCLPDSAMSHVRIP